MEGVLILIRPLMQEKKINSDEFARSCEFTNLHPQLKYSEDKLTAFFDKIFLLLIGTEWSFIGGFYGTKCT